MNECETKGMQMMSATIQITDAARFGGEVIVHDYNSKHLSDCSLDTINYLRHKKRVIQTHTFISPEQDVSNQFCLLISSDVGLHSATRPLVCLFRMRIVY